MATLTQADVKTMIGAAVKAALAAALSAGGGGGDKDKEKDKGGHLDERYFRRVDKFNGQNWKEFSFQFRTAVGSAVGKVRSALDEILKAGKDPDVTLLFVDIAGWQEGDTEKYGAQLYSVLTSLVTGDAMTIVRGVVNGDGWDAWSRLFMRFDPRTPARTLMAMMAVMQPKKAKDARDLLNAVQDWEVKLKNLSVEHSVVIDEKIQVALLSSILPTEFQDYVFQMTDMSFSAVKDKVLSLAINRAAMSKPTPMEVDRVQAHYCHEAAEWEEYEGYDAEHWDEAGAEVEIGYVGESCRRCGGIGHYARECPTPDGKGKGKGEMKGKGKGKANYYTKPGKGGYQEYGSKGKGGGKKGGGKGFGGECWTCGQKGHRSNDCPNKGKSAMEIGCVEDGGSKEIAVGGIWAIAQVKAEECEEGEWEEVRARKGCCATTRLPQSVPLNGRSAKSSADSVRSPGGFTLGDYMKGMRCQRNDYKMPNEKGVKTASPEGAKNGFTDDVNKSFKNGAKNSFKKSATNLCEKGDYEVRNICPVALQAPWMPVGVGEITVDSAAEESVCPKSWGEAYPMRKPKKWLRFVNASGGEMSHYGEKVATFQAGGKDAVVSLGFQVSDVQKPLAAVWRIAEKGNIVQFGPRAEDNFIKNIETGKRINMIQKSGSYVIEANYVVPDPGFARPAVP